MLWLATIKASITILKYLTNILGFLVRSITKVNHLQLQVVGLGLYLLAIHENVISVGGGLGYIALANWHGVIKGRIPKAYDCTLNVCS